MSRDSSNSSKQGPLLPPTRLPALLPPYLRAEIDTKDGLKYHIAYRMEPVPEGTEPLASHLKPLLRRHYPTPDRYARWLKELGAVGAARHVRRLLPTRDTVQAGELGEILMTEFIENVLAVPVPVFKLRHKDGRNVPLRGVDSIGVILEGSGKLIFVKGEAKVAEYATSAVVEEGRKQLDSVRGGVPAHAVLYIVNHSRPDDYELQRECEAYVDRQRKAFVRHLLFVGHNRIVKDALETFLENASSKRRTYAVGLKIENYDAFIPEVFRVGGTP